MEAIIIKSMTGYGRHKEIIAGREITVEVKSVNHRYLDLTIKAPRIYGFLDEHIKKKVSQSVARGKVDVFITIDSSATDETIIEVNENLLSAYLKILKETAEKYQIEDKVDNISITRLPDVMSIKKQEANQDELLESVMAVLKVALTNYTAMREREGQELYNDIMLKKDEILDLVAKIEERSPKTVVEYREKLFAKLSEILESTSIPEDRILAESAIFADKVSVDEETVRLKSHISQLISMCDDTGAIGRKMDFLIQEFNREANTIGSKASDSEVVKCVIELKAVIEKIREQVQNIE